MRKNSRSKLAFLLIISTFFNCSCDHYNENITINHSCTGLVVKKFIDHDNHAAHTLFVQGKGGKNDICYIDSYDKNVTYLYDKVSIGDSIIKKPGSKIYHVKSSEKDCFYEYK
jgi:hypothetical protein